MNKSSLGFLEKLLKFWFILFYVIFLGIKRVPRPKDLQTAKRVDQEGLFHWENFFRPLCSEFHGKK